METNRVQNIVDRNLKDDSTLKKPGVCRKERPDKEKGDRINKSVFFIIIIMFNVCIEPLGYGRLIIHGFVPLLRLFFRSTLLISFLCRKAIGQVASTEDQYSLKNSTILDPTTSEQPTPVMSSGQTKAPHLRIWSHPWCHLPSEFCSQSLRQHHEMGIWWP